MKMRENILREKGVSEKSTKNFSSFMQNTIECAYVFAYTRIGR